MFFNHVSIISVTVFLHIGFCNTFISVCPLSRKLSEGWQKFKRALLCNETLDCKQLKNDVANGYNDFITIYYSRQVFGQLQSLVDKFSHCGIPTVIFDKTQLITANYSWNSLTTLIVDITDDELFSSLDPGKSMQVCYKKSLSDEYNIVEKVVEIFRRTVWITKNVHCNLLDSDSYIVKLCIQPFCNDESIENSLYLKSFRVATVEYPPFVSKITIQNETKYSGIVFEILNEVADQYQFNYTIEEPEDQSYGIYINDSWNGMIGMLQNKEIDFIAAGLTATYWRNEVADFSTAFYSDPISIMIHEQKKPEMLWKLLSLFTWQTWLSIYLAAIVSVFVIFFLHKYSALDTDTGLQSIHQCLWYVACCLTNQGVDNQPKTWSGQHFLAAWCIASFVLISMYSGGLIAMLTTSRISTPFKDLKGLLDKLEWNEFTICVENGTALYDSIINADFEDYARLGAWLAKNPSYVQPNDTSCTDSFLKTNNMAYLAELSFLKNLQKKYCQNYSLIILNDEFLSGDFVFAFQKGSALNNIISSKIINAKESGLIDYWDAAYSQKMSFCHIRQPDQKVFSAEKDQLSMNAFFGAFLILIIGLTISILWFFIEKHHTEFQRCIYNTLISSRFKVWTIGRNQKEI